MNIEEALGKFLVQLQADGRSPHTIKQYRRHIRLFARWAADVAQCRDVSQVSHENLAQFLNAPVAKTRPDGGVKKATSMNALRTSLRCFFHYLHQAGYIAENPGRMTRHALCGRPLPRPMSEDEQARLMDELSQGTGPEARRDHLLFHLMLSTGIRLRSALGLHVEDVDLDRGELWLTASKGNRQEKVFLNSKIRQHLAEFLSDRFSGPVCISRQNKRLCARHAQRRFAEWVGKAGVRNIYSPHSLRHSFAQDLYNQSQDIFLVQRALGHRSIMSTLVYARAKDTHLRQAIQS